jgi:flagellar hook-associated protein 3 FlgL
VGQINDGMKSLRAVRAEVGRRQAQVESMTDRAADRALIMERLVARNEDADMAEVASTLTQQQTTLQASYTVFSRLSNLSLVNFLR